MPGTKIQINSLEALERLIGGDTETEIEIRSGVVQEFSKKWLKSVADELAAKLHPEDMLTGSVREALRAEAEVIAEQALKSALDAGYRDTMHAIEAKYVALNKEISQSFERYITAESVSRLMTKLIDERIKVILGSMLQSASWPDKAAEREAACEKS